MSNRVNSNRTPGEPTQASPGLPFWDEPGPDLLSELSEEEKRLLAVLSDPAGTTRRIAKGGKEPDEVLLRSVIENVPRRQPYIYDHSTGLIVAGGNLVASLYGYTHQEILDMPEGWRSVIHPDDAPRAMENMENLVCGRCELVCLQIRVARKDGSWEWIQHDQRALTRTKDGRLWRALGLVQVITPMAVATQALANEACLTALCRTLVEDWVEGLFLLDEAFRILYINQGAVDKLGYDTSAEVMGRPFQLLAVQEPGRRKGITPAGVDQEQVFRGTHQRKDGSSYPIEITIRRLNEERFLATTRDISDQVESEELNRRQAAYYKGLFENNPCGVAVFDSSFDITEVNPALRKMLGYTERQLCHKNLADIMDPPSRVEIETWRMLAENLDERVTTETEILVRRRDGRLLCAQTAVTLMAGPEGGEFSGIIILTDISARRMAEMELARQFHLNDILVRESAAMIGMVDREGRVIKVNPAVEAASGYTSEELVGKLMWECGLVDEEEVPRARARLQALVEGAPRVTALSRTRTKTGELRIIQVHNTATRNANGEVENFIITAIDMTEQHRLQHHLMEAVEAEQARIGHDLHDGIGQMLTGIGSLVEALELKLKGSALDDACRIRELVREALQQVRQLSRNMSPAAVQNRDLSASLVLLADTVRTQLRRHCVCNLDADVSVTDSTQSSHLFRIAQEAVNNAIRHGNPDNVVLTLRRGEGNLGYLEIFNDGATFDCKPGSASEGIGMRVMNYRASMINAEISVTCPEGGGVMVACKFPLPPGKKSPQTKSKRHTP